MSKTDDGGPAFPQADIILTANNPPILQWTQESPGMSLRDWFAGQALAGLLAHRVLKFNTEDMAARVAYKFADAMLAARKGDGR